MSVDQNLLKSVNRLNVVADVPDDTTVSKKKTSPSSGGCCNVFRSMATFNDPTERRNMIIICLVKKLSTLLVRLDSASSHSRVISVPWPVTLHRTYSSSKWPLRKDRLTKIRPFIYFLSSVRRVILPSCRPRRTWASDVRRTQ